MVFVMLAGLVLSIIFVSARNLTAPIIAHAGFDAFYFAGCLRWVPSRAATREMAYLGVRLVLNLKGREA
jgi:membrane protease YdiL (CAAX protease family)